MRHIVVVAYQLHYSFGSEYSVAMNYVKNMSESNKLTVIYGTSAGFHDIGNTKDMENWLSRNSIFNVDFVALKPSHQSHNYDFSLWGQFKFYKEYKLWHEDVRDYVVQLLKRVRIDIIHYLGPIGYREPGYLYDLPVPYIRGPIGGLGGANMRLLKATGSVKLAIHFLSKRILNELQTRFSWRNIKAMKDSDVLICATTEQQEIVNKMIGHKHHSKILFRQENCLERIYKLNADKFNDDKLRLIFIGSIDGRKGLPIILEALKELPLNANLQLDVVGDGHARKDLEKMAKRNGLDHFISWHGNVPRDQVFEMLGKAHLMLLPSLMEGNPTTVWEAMSQGVPSLTLQNCGMRDTVTNEVGYSIAIKSYSQVICDITKVLKQILDKPQILQEKAYKVMEDRKRYLWGERKEFFEEVYALAEAQYAKRKL